MTKETVKNTILEEKEQRRVGKERLNLDIDKYDRKTRYDVESMLTKHAKRNIVERGLDMKKVIEEFYLNPDYQY